MIWHPLPQGYLLATGKAEFAGSALMLLLKAFMPKGHGSLLFADDDEDGDSAETYEDFERQTCRHCDYYFDEYFDDSPGELEDNDGNPAACVTYKSRCPCKSDGIDWVSWPCAAGHQDPEYDPPRFKAEGPLPPMAYAVDLYSEPIRAGQVCYSFAHIQAVDASTLRVGSVFRSMNTYADHSVCWGNDNDDPQTLPEAVEQYIDTPANQDLLKANEYLDNLKALRSEAIDKPIPGSVIPPGCDAALLVSAAHQPAAFLLLRGTGFPSQEGVIAVGLRRHVLQHGGEWLEGYCTTSIDGRCWFVLPHPSVTEDPNLQGQALLLAQIPDPFSPCSSPEPSSLAPAVLAAS